MVIKLVYLNLLLLLLFFLIVLIYKFMYFFLCVFVFECVYMRKDKEREYYKKIKKGYHTIQADLVGLKTSS